MDVPGVTDVDIDLQSGTTKVNVISGCFELITLFQAVEDAGYRVNEPAAGS